MYLKDCQDFLRRRKKKLLIFGNYFFFYGRQKQTHTQRACCLGFSTTRNLLRIYAEKREKIIFTTYVFSFLMCLICVYNLIGFRTFYLRYLIYYLYLRYLIYDVELVRGLVSNGVFFPLRCVIIFQFQKCFGMFLLLGGNSAHTLLI